MAGTDTSDAVWHRSVGTAFADGAPPVHFERPVPHPLAGTHNQTVKLFSSWRDTLARVARVEGERGLATRYAVFARYAAYLGTIFCCAGLAHVAFAGTNYASAGLVLLFCAATMVGSAAAGTMFLPHRRHKVIEDMRMFLFGGVLFPTAAESAFTWLLRSAASEGDGFMGMVATALPVMFMANAVLPTLVFMKSVAGQRALERTQSSDAELMATWTRQDMFQR